MYLMQQLPCTITLLEQLVRLSNVVGESNVRRIQPDEDSAHVTGYHPASVTEGMSRYNAHRHGFVFSDGGMLQVEGVPSLKPK
jgi:hypothetical protein